MRLACRTWGDARSSAGTVVLLHGAAGWSGSWWRVAPRIAEDGYHVLALDLHGHGDSPASSGLTLDQGARDLRETLAVRLSSEHVTAVWGHSLGAMVALELVASDPNLAEMAVLVDPPVRPARPAELDAMGAAWRQQSALARHRPTELLAVIGEQAPHWDERDVQDTVESLAALDVDTLIGALDHGGAYDGVERLRSLRIPTLVVLASENLGSPVTGADRERVHAVGTPVDVVEIEGGHNLHRDRFITYMEAVLGWLREHRDGAREANPQR